MTVNSTHPFIRACFRQPVMRTPVWILRQTGRYLPPYRNIRNEHSIFKMYKTPELTCELTLMPLQHLDVDAALLFTDQLAIPEAMGMQLKLAKGKWPVFVDPLKNEYQIHKLRPLEPYDSLNYVMDSVRLVQDELDERVPLIGLCGAPWSLAAYMIQGGGSQSFIKAKRWAFARPDLMHALLEKLSEAVIRYCDAIIDVGVDAVQLNDLYVGVYDSRRFQEFVLPYVQKIISAIRRPGVPVIYQCNCVHVGIDSLLETGADVFGLDWTVNLGQIRRQLQQRASIQGNLDPAVLYGRSDHIRQAVQEMLADFGPGSGHIANLGYDIPPDIPFENAKAFVEIVKEESAAFHQDDAAAS